MSDLAASPALPLFHRNVVPLDALRHASLRLDRDAGYGYSAGVESIPIGIGEFEAAATSYPIVFSDGPRPVPAVLLGFRKGWNMFVDARGAWMPAMYVPALVRAFPFVFLQDPATGSRSVGIEADAACLGPAKGQPMFEDGKPTELVREAIALCEACQANLNDSAAFGEALERAGILQAKEATIEANAGGKAQIAGFKMVDPGKLATVPDATFLEWRHRNWIMPLYAHLFSAASWGRFTELAAHQLATRQ